MNAGGGRNSAAPAHTRHMCSTHPPATRHVPQPAVADTAPTQHPALRARGPRHRDQTQKNRLQGHRGEGPHRRYLRACCRPHARAAAGTAQSLHWRPRCALQSAIAASPIHPASRMQSCPLYLRPLGACSRGSAPMPEPCRAQFGALSLVRLTPVVRLTRLRTILCHLCVHSTAGRGR